MHIFFQTPHYVDEMQARVPRTLLTGVPPGGAVAGGTHTGA